MSTKIAALSVPLKAFAEPSTSSAVEARLPLGRYLVAGDAFVIGADTWVPVASAQVKDGASWICIRSGHVEYGKVVDAKFGPAARTTFDDDEHAVNESELISTLKGFSGWGYDLHDPRYPSDVGGVKLPHAPPKVNNCCTFVESLVAGTFARVLGVNFAWSHERHAQMMIESDDDYFSTVTALVETGAAVPIAADDLAPPPPWTVMQGWKSKWQRGHTFLVVDHHYESDKVLILESNCTAELNGTGWRGLGRLDQLAGSGALGLAKWWSKPSVWTWTRVTSSYPLRHRAQLRVRERAIAGLD